MAKSTTSKLPESVDVLIAGGGYVGLSCAVAIKDAAPHLSVMIVDPVPEHAVENDERASAIAADASRMLHALALWEGLVKNAQPINEMIVTDSKVSDVTRPVFHMAGIQTVRWPYDQKGIVCTVEHERPHEGRAEEHFLPAGPFAILPLKGNRSSLVWTESSHDADRLLEQDEMIFETELEQRFGYKLGDIKLASKVKAFPSWSDTNCGAVLILFKWA